MTKPVMQSQTGGKMPDPFGGVKDSPSGAPSATSADTNGGTNPSVTHSGVPGEAPSSTDPSNKSGFIGEVSGASAPRMTASPAGSAADPYINKETDTVEGRLNNLLGQNSDYMKRAETKGLQTAASRGLLNSSMAAGAAHASAIDASLPIAQQDAATYSGFATRNQQLEQQKSLDADKFAQERAIEQYKNDVLSWSQFTKGVADINMQDMSKTAKDQAIANLWKMYQASRPVSSSLANIQIIDGRIVRNSPRQTSGGGSSTASVGNATGPNAGSGGASSGNRSYFQFNSIKDMPQWVQDSYRQRYGNVEPQKARQIAEVLAYAKEKYKDAIRGAPDGKTTGRDYAGAQFGSAGAKKSFQQFVLNELSKVGIKPHNDEINTVAAGPNYAQQYSGQYHAALQFVD